MKNILFFFFTNVLLLTVYSSSGQQTLRVNLSNEFRSATHCASGSLYGVTETLPTDIENLVAPLKPHVFANPAMSGAGRQQPIGDALEVSRRLQNTTGKVQVRLPDVLPGWPYQWPGLQNFLNLCRQVINAKMASGRTNYDGYEIWNEPYGTWKSENGDFHSACWKPTYDLIRSMDPSERIIGPSLAYYNNTRMRDFLVYCKNNNCLPDVISWHQWGAAGFANAYNQYRALEKELGISPRPISINEYSSRTSDPYEGCPGYSVPFIAKFERYGIESACISWWWTNLPGRLGSLLTASNQKGGGWHLYKWYGDMTGNMVQVTPPNENSDGLDGFGCIDKNAQYASICLGGNLTGNATVNISGFPSWFGSQVKVRLEYVSWSNKDTPVVGTSLISETIYTVNNGNISVPVTGINPLYGYRIYLQPANQLPQVVIRSPATDTIVERPAEVYIEAQVSDPSAISTLQFFVNDKQVGATEYVAPYFTTLTITETGLYEITALITDKTGSKVLSPVRTIRTVVPQTGYNYQLHPIPGLIQFEEFDIGANGLAYYDSSPGSETGVNFRTDTDVDIEECADEGGGYNIGYATAGEWLEYSVNVAETGLYSVSLRVACNGDGRTLDLALDNMPLVSGISIPNTTGWQKWTNVIIDEVELPVGEHILRFTIGDVDYINLNYVSFTRVLAPEPPVISFNAPENGAVFSIKDIITLKATASDSDGNIVGVSFYEGENLIATVNTAPYTYNWSALNPGTYIFKSEAFDTDGLSTVSSTVSVTVLGIQEPFRGVAHMIPGRIEAEEYDLGGEGLGYHEANTNGNQGGAPFRNDEVDIELTQDEEGIYNIAYTLTGEWLQYTVEVMSSGVYDLNLRMATDGSDKTLHVEIDGVNVTGPVQVPDTDGWQKWETITVSDVNLTAGEHVMRIVFGSNYMNLNYVEFVDVVTGMNADVDRKIKVFPNPYKEAVHMETTSTLSYKVFSVTGKIVTSGICEGRCLIGETLPYGIYFLNIDAENEVQTIKLIKKY